MIARAADFQGLSTEKVSVLTETVFKTLNAGKKVSLLGSKDTIHSYTYTPDPGKAVALLGNTTDTFAKVGHLPTSNEAYTTGDFINEIAKALGAKPQFQAAGKT